MSLQVEKLEKNMAKLTIEASAEEFEAAIEKAYQKNKSKMNIQGFRKGKAPRKIIEKMYGAGVFYEEAANVIIPDAYAKAVDECDLEIVSQPSVDVVQVEAGKPFIFTAEVAVKPEVKLGDYKGIEVEKTDVEVSDDDVNAEIDRVREQNARTITVEDRAVQDKDTAVIDFEGFVDGVAFEGGKGEDYPLTIGSHSFIDNFEEQLIGKNIGEEAEVNVTFPEDYHVEDLKGKPATFKVTVKEIKAKELPELDDDFAQDVSECETVDAYKAQVKEELTKKKEDAAKAAKEDEAVAKVVENAEMEIPEPMIDTQVRQMVDDFARRMQSQGLSLDQYFQFTGMEPKAFLEQMRPQALKRIQSRLVLEAIVEAEKIEATEAEIEDEMKKMADAYQMELDKVKELIGDEQKKQLAQDLAVQKAAEFVVENTVEK
ncbi:trigger factor [Clostridium sp. CAG:411]|jgi:trigger factor|nr:trigger factor [Lachnospiraceae bacterium]CDE44507.1 trigger factor [Clostridium sp. CAG:411]